ncbi:hypothetical protein FQR65_LT18936 [Abscondita terminalis]|nr:hypothetical protein FQR65_LT18936 [Abscondita terminalis]
MSDFLIDEELLAAIDMGSNSFHLAIARVDHGEVKKVASMSEKVQLAAGLDENKNLTEAAQQRGLACLARFVGRLSSVQPNRLRIVATNALRQAKNGHEFIQKAAEILPKPIEIIAGREEARLIYLGVSHTMVNSGRRLVIDIVLNIDKLVYSDGGIARRRRCMDLLAFQHEDIQTGMCKRWWGVMVQMPSKLNVWLKQHNISLMCYKYLTFK